MNKKITILIISLLVILVAAYASLQSNSQKNVPEEAPIKIGVIAPLTGFVSIYGQTEKNTIDFAIQEINQQGGINGRQIELIYEDDKGLAKDAVNAISKLIYQDQVKIVLGGTLSSETLAAAPIARDQDIIMFSVISSSPEVSKYANIFRNQIDSYKNGQKLGLLIKQSNIERLALITEQHDYPIALRNGLLDTIDSNKKIVIVYDEFSQMGENDYNSYIAKINNSEPDALVLLTVAGDTAGRIVKELKESGFDKQIYSDIAPGTQDFASIAGNISDGIIFTDVSIIDEGNLKLQEILSYFESKNFVAANNYFTAARYDSIYILKDALEYCGEDNTCIAERMRSKTYNGLIGEYGFDENGDIVGLEIGLRQIVDGEPVAYQ